MCLILKISWKKILLGKQLCISKIKIKSRKLDTQFYFNLKATGKKKKKKKTCYRIYRKIGLSYLIERC